jgi:hypothetical protein
MFELDGVHGFFRSAIQDPEKKEDELFLSDLVQLLVKGELTFKV